jgi:hypothetical protein
VLASFYARSALLSLLRQSKLSFASLCTTTEADNPSVNCPLYLSLALSLYLSQSSFMYTYFRLSSCSGGTRYLVSWKPSPSISFRRRTTSQQRRAVPFRYLYLTLNFYLNLYLYLCLCIYLYIYTYTSPDAC